MEEIDNERAILDIHSGIPAPDLLNSSETWEVNEGLRNKADVFEMMSDAYKKSYGEGQSKEWRR